MALSRRSVIQGITIAGAATGLSSCGANSKASSDEATASAKTTPSLAIPAEPDGLLLNHANAVEEMQKASVDLLICTDPVNVRYLTNQRPTGDVLGMDGSAYATLSSSIDKRPTFISSRIQNYFDTPKSSVTEQLDFHYVGLPAEPEILASLTDPSEIANAPGKTFAMPRVHETHPLSHLEQRRLDQIAGNFTELKASMDSAVLTEILEADLPNKTIAIDDPRLRPVIEKSGMDIRIVDGERLIRRIRMVKSAAEIEYMRFAATANGYAARTAARSVREGANFRDVRQEFAKACAEIGTTAKFMMLDTHTTALAEGEIKDGRSFLMDAVSTFEEYHGDYGRTVCLGEPNQKMQQVIDGLSWVWDRIFPELKPGMTYMDIYALSGKLFAETGVDVGYAVNPHNVGMHHHDEPNAVDFSISFAKDVGIELKEGMIVSIDMPVLDVGMGGSAHLEDCVLITKDGPEFINDPSDRFIVV